MSHIDYVQHDPIFGRVVHLSKLPNERTLSRWLKRFRVKTVAALSRLNAQVVWDTFRDLSLRRATIDIDGTVVSTGLQVGWAMRGYNPVRPDNVVVVAPRELSAPGHRPFSERLVPMLDSAPFANAGVCYQNVCRCLSSDRMDLLVLPLPSGYADGDPRATSPARHLQAGS